MHTYKCISTHIYVYVDYILQKRPVILKLQVSFAEYSLIYMYMYTNVFLHTYQLNTLIRYGVATISRLLKIVSLFYKRAL